MYFNFIAFNSQEKHNSFYLFYFLIEKFNQIQK